MSAPVESPIGPLKLTMDAVARYTNVTGGTLEADLDTDVVGTGGVVRVLWACKQFGISKPSLSTVADEVEAYLDGGGDFTELAGAMSEAVKVSAWYRALLLAAGAGPYTSLRRDAFAAGLTPSEFALCDAEEALAFIDAASRRDITIAWHTAALSRTSKFPDLASILDPVSDDEVRQDAEAKGLTPPKE